MSFNKHESQGQILLMSTLKMWLTEFSFDFDSVEKAEIVDTQTPVSFWESSLDGQILNHGHSTWTYRPKRLAEHCVGCVDSLL